MRNKGSLEFLGAMTLAVCVGATASAAPVTNIASTITNAGSCTLTSTCAESYLVTTQGGTNQAVNVPPAGSFGFTDSFNQGSNVSTGSNLGPSAYYGAAAAGAPWNFQDNILFSTNGAKVQAQVSALLTDVQDIQVRIISLTNPATISPTNPTGTPFDVTSTANAATLLSANGVVTVQSAWSTASIPGVIDYSATMGNTVSPGSYILQVRGEAFAGSSYSGTIDFTPVPLPAAGWLLLSVLGGAALLLVRRPATSKLALSLG